MSVVRYFCSVLLLFAVWQLSVVAFRLPPYLLPSPVTVITTLTSEWVWFSQHTIVTLRNAIVGGTLGITLGFCVGMAIAYSRVLRWIAEPYLVIFQSFPRESLIPLIIVWLGFGDAPKAFNAALLCFFPAAVITANGVSDVRADYLELIRSWGASKREEYFLCRLPAALYGIIGGLKIAAPLALIGCVLGEFMGGNAGLGHVIVSSSANFRLDRSFAALIILAAVGVAWLAMIQLALETVLKKYGQE